MHTSLLVLIASIALQSPGPAASEPPLDTAAETANLENIRQLTFPDRFTKAGEAYFSPDMTKLVFQAIEVPAEGETAADFYAMFVADLERDGEGRIAGLDNIRRLSPPGSANTCGWFHPIDPNRILFGSTLVPPTESAPPGYQRGSGRYRWMFPPGVFVQTRIALRPMFETTLSCVQI